VPLDHGRVEMLGASSNSRGHLPGEVRLQTINLRQLPSSPDPFTVPPVTVDVNHEETSALEDVSTAVGGRYSMRTRQPRQLQPYAFDRLEYKHQLKHHPEAIVKLSGYRSPVKSSSPPPFCPAEDTDRTTENSGDERPSEVAHILPRAKRKKRHRTNTEHPSALPSTAHQRTSKVQVSMGSPPLARRFTGSSARADIGWVASIPDLGDDSSPERAAIWYPDVFNDLSSGPGSDDVPLNAYQNDVRVNDTPPPRIKRRRVIFSLLRLMSTS